MIEKWNLARPVWALTVCVSLSSVGGGAPASASAEPTSELCAGQSPTIVAPESGLVRGTEGQDVILASRRNKVVALGGDDTICGGRTVLGGDGDDIIGIQGPLHRWVRADLHGEGGDDLIVITGRVDSMIKGGAGNDEIHAGEALNRRNELFGDDGDDLILGSGADDFVLGGPGDDRIRGSAGVDVLHGGTGVDVVSAGADGDTATGGVGDDFIFGEGGNDVIKGSYGSDYGNGGRDGTVPGPIGNRRDVCDDTVDRKVSC